MFSLSVVFGSASVAFLFKSQESAEAAYTIALDSIQDVGCYFEVKDDFGQIARINRGSIHGIILEDMMQGRLARAEQIVHHARCQTLAQKIAGSDPGLRMMNTPAMVNQMGMNGR